MATAAASAVPARAETDSQTEFATIVRENQAMVYSIAYHFFRDRALAEDLAQDVFLQLHKNQKKLQSAEHATHWLRKVAIHRCIDYERRRCHARETALDQVPEPSAEPCYADPLLLDGLRGLVAALPEKKRLLVILRYQEEMKFSEIAKLLRVPERTLRTQLHRTLALLRGKASRLLGGNDL